MFRKRKSSSAATQEKSVTTLERVRTIARKLGSFEAAMKAAEIDVQDYIKLRAQAGEWSDVMKRLDEHRLQDKKRKLGNPTEN